MIKKYEFWWASVKYEDCDVVERRSVLVIGKHAFIIVYYSRVKDM